MYLENSNGPEDVKKLNAEAHKVLAQEIRDNLLVKLVQIILRNYPKTVIKRGLLLLISAKMISHSCSFSYSEETDTEFILPKVQVCYTSRSSSTEKPPLLFELPPISWT